MKSLWLLRHAKSAWDTDVATDFERPLAKRGRRDALRIGHWLVDNHIAIDQVICSSAARAQQTLGRVRRYWSIADDSVVANAGLYHADSTDLIAAVQAAPSDSSSLMLVGHNPGLDHLLIHYCGRQLPLSASGKLMTTAALAQIELSSWSDSSGELAELIRPKELTH